MTKEQKIKNLIEFKKQALLFLNDDGKQALVNWIRAESEAYNIGIHNMPSYTDSEAGAEHALDSLANEIEEEINP
jgi:hypothetical protein